MRHESKEDLPLLLFLTSLSEFLNKKKTNLCYTQIPLCFTKAFTNSWQIHYTEIQFKFLICIKKIQILYCMSSDWMMTTAPLWPIQSGLAICRSMCFTWGCRGSSDQVWVFPVCPRAMCGQWGTGPAPALPLWWRCSRLRFLSCWRRPTFLCVHTSRKARRLKFSPSHRNTSLMMGWLAVSVESHPPLPICFSLNCVCVFLKRIPCCAYIFFV